jgi:serine/threonine protein kinase
MPNRYKIYEPLGAGGSATVYRAYDTQMKRWVAAKRLIGREADPQLISELRREAGLLAGLSSQHIVTVFDVDDDEEGLFMIMELLQGDDLADILDEGPLSLQDFRELVQQTLEALHTCHTHRIVHRDLKPANIKIDREAGGRLVSKIIDFGISRTGMNARKQTERHDGMILGSVHYMAPEQLGRTACDHRADIYAMGCIFYEALSGRRAVDSPNIYDLIEKHMTHDFTSLQVVCPHLPLPLVGWIESGLMALKPEERYQSALEALEAFRTVELLSDTAETGASVKKRSTAVSPSSPKSTRLQPQKSETTVNVVERQQAQSTKESFGSKMPYLLGALSACALGGWYFLFGPGADQIKASSSATTANSAPVVPTASPQPAESSKPAADPPLEPEFAVDPLFKALPKSSAELLHFCSNVGSRNFTRRGNSKAMLMANLGDATSLWHDLAPQAGDTPLKVYENRKEAAPVLQVWKDLLLKPGLTSYYFGKTADGSASMNLIRQLTVEDSFPMGKGAPHGTAMAVVMQVDASHLPNRLGRMVSSAKTGILSLRVDEKKRLILETRSEAVEHNITLISEGIDATLPLIAVVNWEAKTQNISLRARCADGSSWNSLPTQCVPFTKAMRNFEVGRVKEYGSHKPAAPLDQFHGHVAEIVVYNSSLAEAELQELQQTLATRYFAK